MGWTENVTRMREWKAHIEFWWGNLRERDYLEDPGIDERIIFT
jgi:hypothetical protein